MAATHGAAEALAEQWKIRNVAHANLLKHHSFPVVNAPSVNVDKILASRADHSVDEHTADTTNGLSDVQSISCPTRSLLP